MIIGTIADNKLIHLNCYDRASISCVEFECHEGFVGANVFGCSCFSQNAKFYDMWQSQIL